MDNPPALILKPEEGDIVADGIVAEIGDQGIVGLGREIFLIEARRRRVMVWNGKGLPGPPHRHVFCMQHVIGMKAKLVAEMPIYEKKRLAGVIDRDRMPFPDLVEHRARGWCHVPFSCR